ncbi:MAG TPA: nucleotidyltransferase family protein [Syntrophomonadaceae bacterium]|nr:nucleotidyltransferase family protein [Syntrophomonadaceae bacterium]
MEANYPPPTKETVLREIEKFSDVIKGYSVRRIGVFGSVVRGEANAESDIDLLVEFSEKTLDNYFGLKFFLEDLFGKKVDLVIAENVKPRLRPIIFSEVEYAAGF